MLTLPDYFSEASNKQTTEKPDHFSAIEHLFMFVCMFSFLFVRMFLYLQTGKPLK